jgi:hypothetical protein
MKTTGVLCWIALAGSLPAADELEQQREQMLESVKQAWEAVEAVEPVIPLIKLESGGTAFEFIRQMEEALGKKESSPIVVAVPAKILSSLRIENFEQRNIPLSAAMENLSKVTGLRTTRRDGVWWVEGAKTLDGEFITRTYRLGPEIMKAIGLEHDGNAKSANVSRRGKSWPVEKGSAATYVPSSKILVVRALKKEIDELDAIVVLQQAGYDVTLRK